MIEVKQLRGFSRPDAPLKHKGMERLWFFLVPLAVLILAETAWPRRERHLGRSRRWIIAVVLLSIGVGLSRLIVPAGLIGLAYWANIQELGLFNYVAIPALLAGVICFILLDFAVWLQHYVMHRVPLLWHLHRVHHADRDVDVFTALRFHPGELLVSLFWKGAVVVALGADPLTVLIFEIALNLGAMFNHSNLNLPIWMDRRLRLFIVTPDMHRVHHSTDKREGNHNFGFFIPWWDRLFRLYTAQPARGHLEMDIGA